jgi:nucleotide-binding universal stress UspA family protein
MTVPAGRPVVVGVDGSSDSWRGLAWAAREAEAQHRALRIVHAWEVPVPGYVPVPETIELVRAAAQLVVDEALVKVGEWAPGLAVSARLVHGTPARVLLDEGRDAAVVVLGSHGRGGFARLVMGSTSGAVAAHAAAPVVVVRGDDHAAAWRAGPVIVGLDGSALSDHALEFAFQAASRRGGVLRAVHAWNRPDPLTDETRALLDEGAARIEEAKLALAESLAGWQAQYPDVTVRHTVADAHPVAAMLGEGADAALVVVGSRGRGGFTGLLLGSVSRGVLLHASCPVAVVRPQATV